MHGNHEYYMDKHLIPHDATLAHEHTEDRPLSVHLDSMRDGEQLEEAGRTRALTSLNRHEESLIHNTCILQLARKKRERLVTRPHRYTVNTAGRVRTKEQSFVEVRVELTAQGLTVSVMAGKQPPLNLHEVFVPDERRYQHRAYNPRKHACRNNKVESYVFLNHPLIDEQEGGFITKTRNQTVAQFGCDSLICIGNDRYKRFSLFSSANEHAEMQADEASFFWHDPDSKAILDACANELRRFIDKRIGLLDGFEQT